MVKPELANSLTERVIAGALATAVGFGAVHLAESDASAAPAAPRLGKIQRVCVPPGTTVHSLTDYGPYLYSGKVFRRQTTVKVREILNPHQGGVGDVYRMASAFPGRVLLENNPYDFDRGMNVKSGPCSAPSPNPPEDTPGGEDIDIIGISDGDDLENGGTTVEDANGDGVMAAQTPNGSLYARVYCRTDTDNGIPTLTGWVKTSPKVPNAVPVRGSLMNLNVPRTNLLNSSVPLDATGYGLINGRSEIAETPFYGQPSALIQFSAYFGGGDNPNLKTSPSELCYGDGTSSVESVR